MACAVLMEIEGSRPRKSSTQEGLMLQVVEQQSREIDQHNNIYIGSQRRMGLKEDKYVFVDA